MIRQKECNLRREHCINVKRPFKELLYKVIQAAFVSYCVFKKLMKDIIIAALPMIISKMTPS